MFVDYLIIGQGLAGSLLAWELMQRGAKVLVVDNGRPNASQVAAGLINPITGMRFVKGPHTDQQLLIAMNFYQQLETHFGQSFYIKKPMLRIIRNENELNYCIKRLKDPQYQNYFDHFIEPGLLENSITAPLGSLLQKQTGYLLTRPLLNRLKEFFIEKDSYLDMSFTYLDIKDDANSIKWKNVESGKIIFCDGHQCTENPWFSWLPFQPVKGEILTLTVKKPLPDRILNYGNWLIPVNQNTFRTGATFDRENLDTRPTESGRKSLLKSLAAVCTEIKPETTIAHRANIRPCTQDKNPFIGLHPQNRKIAIFNGFGSKGSLLIPGYAIQFANYLTKKIPISESADIKRYEATHYLYSGKLPI